MSIEFQFDQIGNLAEFVAPIDPDMCCADVYEALSVQPDTLCLPVVRNGRPVGLVDRNAFCTRLADRFGRALFEKKPVAVLMEPDPLIVEAALPIDDLSSRIVSDRPGALQTGFIVTHEGRYLGIGTALSMLRMRVAVTQKQAEELDAARRKRRS